jgi:hypothetical protein
VEPSPDAQALDSTVDEGLSDAPDAVDAADAVTAVDAADAGDTTDAASPVDQAAAPDSAGGFCRSGGFSAPELVQIDGLDPDMFGPRLSADGSTLYLSEISAFPMRDEDIFTLLRAPGGGAHFDRLQRLDALNSPTFDGSPFIARDGLEIIFSSSRGGFGSRDLWTSRRASLSAGWGAPMPISEINSLSDEQNPSLTGDALVLFFSSNREGTAGREDIYSAFRTSRTARFSPAARVIELSSGNKEGAPFITPDGLTIYFSSSRPGGKGGLDLWVAERPSRTLRFDVPVPLPLLNSPFHEEDPSISADGRELFFSSNRDGRNYRIYRATRCN